MIMTSNKKSKSLTIFKTKDAIKSAKSRVAVEMTDKQYGLRTRFKALNRAMSKYFRFGKVVMIAGMSGSGKSYFLNMLRHDFLDNVNVNYGTPHHFNLGQRTIDLILEDGVYRLPKEHEQEEETHGKLFLDAHLIMQQDGTLIHQAINKDCIYKVVLIHFGFEMDAEDELIRNAGTVIGKGYGYLMSSEWDKNLKNYRRLSTDQYEEVETVLDTFADRNEYYIPTSGTVDEILVTVAKIAKVNPGAKLVITIDHTLLSNRSTEKSDAELQQSMAKAAVFLRQEYGALVILLNQLNQKIEADDRITTPMLHYPTKKDIHQGNQIFWACDTVIINHRPIVLGIKTYGPDKLDTTNLIHGHIVKNRQGRTGNLWFREDFANGRIHAAKKEDFKLKKG